MPRTRYIASPNERLTTKDPRIEFPRTITRQGTCDGLLSRPAHRLWRAGSGRRGAMRRPVTHFTARCVLQAYTGGIMRRSAPVQDRPASLQGSLALAGLVFGALVLLAACGPGPLTAPAPKPLPKIGVLCVLCPPAFDGPAPPGPLVAAFLEGLRTLGHLDGETVTIVWRGAGG